MCDEIDTCEWIYLRDLGEPEDNSLRLVIEEAKANGLPEDIEVLPDVIISDARAIESDDNCRVFELVWPTYVCYAVRNGSFCTTDTKETWQGRLFCLYSKSHFLDYVVRATFADDEYPGPLRHWGINCQNHIIDVVSSSEPQVRQLKPA